MVNAETAASRKFGINLVGAIPWGTHLCQFYESKQDLIDILVPYFAEGLRSNEFCMWVTSPPLEVDEAKEALKKAVPALEDYLRKGQIVIISYSDWYLLGGKFDCDRVLQGWVEKEENALKRGFEGLRLTGNTFWVERNLWNSFVDYEGAVNDVIGEHKMLALCTYCLGNCSGSDVLDVVRNHIGTLLKQGNKWSLVEDVLHRQKAEEKLRVSEERYHSLFSNMMDGFAYCKMIFDEENKPIDFVYLEINDAFEKITGLKRNVVVGEKVTKAIPGIEKANPELFEIYGRVALSCQDEKFEIFFKPLSLWLSVSVYCPSKGYFAAVFEDITERKKAEEALRKLNSHLRAISNSNQALMHAADESEFTQEVCNIIINDCGYSLVWVGFAENDKAKSVRPVAFAGFDKEYINALRVTWDEKSERGRGPTGTAIRTGKPYICKNMRSDPNFKPWRAQAADRGYTASLALPLASFEGETFGALNIYSKDASPFTDDEVKLLTELANDFAYGIVMLRLRKERDQTEETLREQASLIDLSPETP
jgi:PAS domain S-box-containing protein